MSLLVLLCLDVLVSFADNSADERHLMDQKTVQWLQRQRQPLYVTPSWLDIYSWSDTSGLMGAAFKVFVAFNKTHARDVVGLKESPIHNLKERNFFSGKSAISDTPERCMTEAADFCESSRVYVGDWKQSVNGDQYPFDDQVAHIRLELLSPADFSYYLSLQCSPNELLWPSHLLSCTAFDEHGKEIVTGGMQESAAARKIVLGGIPAGNNPFPFFKAGFTWQKLTCEVQDNTVIPWFTDVNLECYLEGRRSGTKSCMQQLLPGLIMLVIGFFSFQIPISMAMPRVATSMIALLTFTNKGSHVVAQLPSVGTSIVEILYMGGMICMLLNVVGHVISFKFKELEDEIAQFNFNVVFFGFIVVLAAVLHTKKCPQLSQSFTLTLVVVLSVIWILSVTYVIYTRWGSIKKLRKIFRARAKEIVEGSDTVNQEFRTDLHELSRDIQELSEVNKELREVTHRSSKKPEEVERGETHDI